MSPESAGRLFVVAGHDPTGGAGIDADREAAAHFGVEVEWVVTAWTDQDGERVLSLGARPAQEWASEARERLGADHTVWKSGLLPGADHVLALASLIAEACERPGAPAQVVVDPVLSASGGEPFLDPAGVGALLDELLPLGVILTPNLPEAAQLTGADAPDLVRHDEARIAAARALLDRGARAVLLKAGHAPESPVRDLLLERDAEPLWLTRDRVPGPGLHGSGCRHASAIAAQLVRGVPLPTAAAEAGTWLSDLLSR